LGSVIILLANKLSLQALNQVIGIKLLSSGFVQVSVFRRNLQWGRNARPLPTDGYVTRLKQEFSSATTEVVREPTVKARSESNTATSLRNRDTSHREARIEPESGPSPTDGPVVPDPQILSAVAAYIQYCI